MSHVSSQPSPQSMIAQLSNALVGLVPIQNPLLLARSVLDGQDNLPGLIASESVADGSFISCNLLLLLNNNGV